MTYYEAGLRDARDGGQGPVMTGNGAGVDGARIAQSCHAAQRSEKDRSLTGHRGSVAGSTRDEELCQLQAAPWWPAENPWTQD